MMCNMIVEVNLEVQRRAVNYSHYGGRQAMLAYPFVVLCCAENMVVAMVFFENLLQHTR
jgi:hypothetical protein